MSDLHSEQATPRTHDREGRVVKDTNDPTALNGGSARHWFAPGAKEMRPTPRKSTKVMVAVGIWGGLLVALLLLMTAV